MEMSEIPQAPLDNVSNTTSVAYGTFLVSKSENEEDETEETENDANFFNEIKIRKLSRQEIQSAAKGLLYKLLSYGETLLLFFEIHFYKIMLFSTFLLAVNSVELLHFAFIILGVVGLKAKTESQFLITRLASLASAILLITTMIYQVDYIDHENYEANCTTNELDANKSVTNNAEWVGFKKESKSLKLTDLIKPYLLYIVLVSVHSFIVLYQTFTRIKQNRPPRTPSVVFKNVRRSDADKDLPHLMKYLINYGFYKFGVEICLIGYLTVIGYRMDIVACFYAVWLFFLYKIERTHASKVWNYATCFLIISIPIQYISLIGLPPGLCITYPWKNVTNFEDFSIFAFLPDTTYAFKFKAKMLLLDFVLLLLMCRQIIVFRVETRYENSISNYPGGSNKSVLKDIDQLGVVPFENPTHDFIEKIRNYLDVIKRFVFIIFFWATLAIVFLTGTSRVNLLSLGYIIGSFIFLWQGTDFYLRPIFIIMKWWNYLIAYNVWVVIIKTFIQLIGCLLVNHINCTVIKVLFFFQRKIFLKKIN
jgi:piezo-type mechanosensitive ion channel component 1/2